MTTGRVCVLVGQNGEPIPVPPPSPIEMTIEMPDGWLLLDDGSAVKEVYDSAGAVVARLTTHDVILGEN